MARYVKNPVEVEAFRWTGDADQTDDPVWIVEAIRAGSVRFNRVPEVEMVIQTDSGEVTANPGDYIIRGIHGELYPCKSDIFEATYKRSPELPGFDAPHERRLLVENIQLEDRIDKLSDFIAKGRHNALGERIARSLKVQLSAMRMYRDELLYRIGLIQQDKQACAATPEGVAAPGGD